MDCLEIDGTHVSPTSAPPSMRSPRVRLTENESEGLSGTPAGDPLLAPALLHCQEALLLGSCRLQQECPEPRCGSGQHGHMHCMRAASCQPAHQGVAR